MPGCISALHTHRLVTRTPWSRCIEFAFVEPQNMQQPPANHAAMKNLLSLLLIALVGVQSATAIQIPASADASVSTASASARKNYGSLKRLAVSKNQSAYIAFDLSALPLGTTSDQVTGATLRLFVESPLSPGAVVIRPASTPWLEEGISGSNAPAPTGAAIRVEISNQRAFVDVDVTSFVQAWVNGLPNNGLIIAPEVAGSPIKINFDSKENTASAHPPILDITLGKVSTFRKFTVNVASTDWDSGAHYGEGNVHRAFTIPPALTGGINLANFYYNGGVVIIYARPTGNSALIVAKQLPFIYSRGTTPSIGTRIEYFANRGEVAIAKTTNGWDSLNLTAGELPSNVELNIVLIGNAH